MFRKAYKVKSNVPLKGSDVKRIKQRLEQSFPNASLEQLLPSKSTVSLLQIVTHGEFRTNVYVVDKLPMFFEIEDKVLVPTLYAMWLVPELLPYFTTVPGVLPKLSNGAHLMLPGVVAIGTGMNIYGRYKKNQLVAVNLTSNKAAVAVGILPRSSEDLYMSGGHGVAVQILHIFGDKLWSHEPTCLQQVPNQKPAALTTEDFPALGVDSKKTKENQHIEQTPKTLSEIMQGNDGDRIEDVDEVNIDKLDISASNNSNETTTPDGEDGGVTVTPEQILKNAFLAALKNHGKSLQLPLLTSNFFRLYVVAEASEPLDLKKTKYKKLSNFLNEMIDQGFIVVREETKGVDKIISIDLNHPELENFIVDFKRPTITAETDEQPLFQSELTELYIVTDETAPFFTKLNYKRGEGIPTAQIKKIVREYINKQNLPTADKVTKSFQLDETLQKICDCTEASLNKISNAVLLKMEQSYEMRSVKDMNTNKPLIQMSLATRSGNKKVTLVSNIECYGIIVSEFIKLCKQGAAASTTIVKLPHQKHDQLQIQGNQVRFVHNLLTQTYKVPSKCILGLELAKNEKKHKKH